MRSVSRCVRRAAFACLEQLALRRQVCAASRSAFENLEGRRLLAGVPFDFGDAPDTYRTTLAVDGARHEVLPGLNFHLGAAVDIENDGQPSPGADRDDTTG